MDALQYFAKRDRLADKFGLDPQEVPPEAVWFLSERDLTSRDIERGAALAKEWVQMAVSDAVTAPADGYPPAEETGGLLGFPTLH